jgi:hypothetical protein
MSYKNDNARMITTGGAGLTVVLLATVILGYTNIFALLIVPCVIGALGALRRGLDRNDHRRNR